MGDRNGWVWRNRATRDSHPLLRGILLAGVVLWGMGNWGDRLGAPARAIAQGVPVAQVRPAASPPAILSQTLLTQGRQRLHQADLKAAEPLLQQALAAATTQGDRTQLAQAQIALAELQQRRGQYAPAVVRLQRALALLQSGPNPTTADRQADQQAEIAALNGLGDLQASQGQYAAAIETLRRSLTLAQAHQDQRGEAIARSRQARIAANRGEYGSAVAGHQQALALLQAVGDRRLEGQILSELGGLYYLQGDITQAKTALQQARQIARTVQDPFGETLALNALAVTQNVLDSNPQRLVLPDFNRAGVFGVTGGVPGRPLLEPADRPASALELLQQALQTAQTLGLREIEGLSLANLATVYRRKGQYTEALGALNPALALSRDIGDRAAEGRVLHYLGNVYLELGQYERAGGFLQQALAIAQPLQLRDQTLVILNSLGELYFRQGQLEPALLTRQQVLRLSQQLGNRVAEANALNNLGAVHAARNHLLPALRQFQQALSLSQTLGDRVGEAINLNNIGFIYDRFRNHRKAVTYYQQSLVITRSVSDRPGESQTLANLGNSFAKQGKPELAIVFFKQAVKVHETIRENLQSLPQEQQEIYIQTIADTYRQLADLLLQNDRILEAQQVLDRLKLQELKDYLQATRSPQDTLVEKPPELEILKKYNALQTNAIQLGQELSQLQQIPESRRTPKQQQRLQQLVQLQTDLNQQFNQFTDRPDVVALLQQLSPKILRQTVDLTALDSLRDDLRRLDAVLLYPLVLDDRLELILTTPDAPPLRRTIPLNRTDLNQAIAQFRRDLRDPTANPQASAQQFYQWLIKPLETELKQAKTTTIIYAPDAQLRYLPLTALHDGQQWLIQRYRVNNITARSLTNFTRAPQPILKVLAGAFVNGNYSVQGGDRALTFSGLPYAGLEIEGIKNQIPATNLMVDRAFSRDATISRLNDYNVLHMATHAAFVPGAATDSFILFGNGEKATLKDIETWTLNKVDLVVLSACETGLGGKFGPNGEEILGLGYQFQNRGARATVASLWKVDDGGTQTLMDAFYRGLKQGNLSKAEALRQAQVTLLKTQFAHPYYWSAFIMIGNGL